MIKYILNQQIVKFNRSRKLIESSSKILIYSIPFWISKKYTKYYAILLLLLNKIKNKEKYICENQGVMENIFA